MYQRVVKNLIILLVKKNLFTEAVIAIVLGLTGVELEFYRSSFPSLKKTCTVVLVLFIAVQPFH